MLRVKSNINLDEKLIEMGFTKARDYFHCDNISVRICDREVVVSYTQGRVYHPIDKKISISNILLKMIDEGILE